MCCVTLRRCHTFARVPGLFVGSFRLAALLAFASLIKPLPAAALEPVDLELVLAVDVSYSMDLDEQRLQRDGYVEAFRDPMIIKAIQSGQHGRIAVTYIEWAGWDVQEIVVPWTIVDGPETGEALARRLVQAPISRQRRTSVTGALVFSERQFGKGGFSGERRVIDVSGDGPNNSGPPVEPARDAVVAKGVVINGLPIVLKTGGPFDIPNLDEYYANCVVGGPRLLHDPHQAEGRVCNGDAPENAAGDRRSRASAPGPASRR